MSSLCISLKENNIALKKLNEHALLSVGSLQLILCYEAKKYRMVDVGLYAALNNILWTEIEHIISEAKR